MNGRIQQEETPEARIGAAARSLVIKMRDEFNRTNTGPCEPDYADFREGLRPFIKRELLMARIEEARKYGAKFVTARVAELNRELQELYKTMPSEFRV
jgi:hypothetical protein